MATVYNLYWAQSQAPKMVLFQLNPINDLHTLPLMSQAKIVRNGLQSQVLSPIASPIRMTSIYNMFNGFQFDVVQLHAAPIYEMKHNYIVVGVAIRFINNIYVIEIVQFDHRCAIYTLIRTDIPWILQQNF